MNFKERLERLQKVKYYLTAPRFAEILMRKGISASVTTQLWDVWRKGWEHLINSPLFTDEIISIFIAAESEIEFDQKYHKIVPDERYAFRKAYYRKGGEMLSVECNLDTYEGIKALCTVYETADEIIAILDWVAKIKKDKSPNWQDAFNVYEHDFFFTHDDWRKSDKVFIACRGHFKELLYTSKYGYLTAEGKANYDKETIKLPDYLNMDKDKVSEYAVTRDEYRYAGNLITDLHLLKNQEEKNNRQ